MRYPATIFGLTLAITGLTMSLLGMKGAAGQEWSQQKKTARPLTKKETIAKLVKIQLQAAQKAHRAAVGSLEVQRVQGFLVFKGNRHEARPEMVCTWSVRWLHAQCELSGTKDERIAAFADHHKRMKELKAHVKMLVAANANIAGGGLLPNAEISAADWYLAEAELWLLKEGGK